MHVLVEAVRQWAVGVGGVGLFVIALLDSSVLSFPQVADALVLLQSARHPHAMPYYAGMTTLGSLVGCFGLYAAGRSGGNAFLRRRFKATHVDRAFRLYHRFGVLVVIVPALLPPPAPFKIFVLLSGAAGMSPLAFGAAVAIGRGARYFAQGWLAARYGDRAADLIARHGAETAAVLLAIAVVGVLAYVLWRRAGAPVNNERFAPEPGPAEAD